MNHSLIASLTLPQNTSLAQNVSKIADLLGINSTIGEEITDKPCVAILSGRDYDQYHEQLEANHSRIFVYDVNNSEILSQNLKTREQISQSTEILTTHPEFTDVLTGLFFQSVRKQQVFLTVGEFEPLIISDGFPILLRRGNLFVSTVDTVANIDESVPKECDAYRTFFDSLIPFVLFIKWAFGNQCWHLSHYHACITIDDPLLQPNYGFIQFDTFLDWLNRNELAATFAFIPWNYKRSNQKIANMFRDNAHCLSICVHGCDHTGNEFGTTDTTYLKALSQTAIERMQVHQQRYNLAYDPIMIFPQGRFSNISLNILARSGYIAAVNSSLFPADYTDAFSLRDMLSSSFSHPNQVPLYQRHYPVHIFDFACDLLFEKPLIITQHHNDFAEGFESLERFAKQLKQIKPQLEWVPLGKLIEHCNWERTGADQQQFVKHNDLPQENSSFPTKQVLRYSPQERVKVALRRYLSEFRDNFVHKSPLLNRIVGVIRK